MSCEFIDDTGQSTHLAFFFEELGEEYIANALAILDGKEKKIQFHPDVTVSNRFGVSEITITPFSPNPPEDTIWFDLRIENQVCSVTYFIYKDRAGKRKHVIERDLKLQKVFTNTAIWALREREELELTAKLFKHLAEQYIDNKLNAAKTAVYGDNEDIAL